MVLKLVASYQIQTHFVLLWCRIQKSKATNVTSVCNDREENAKREAFYYSCLSLCSSVFVILKTNERRCIERCTHTKGNTKKNWDAKTPTKSKPNKKPTHPPNQPTNQTKGSSKLLCVGQQQQQHHHNPAARTTNTQACAQPKCKRIRRKTRDHPKLQKNFRTETKTISKGLAHKKKRRRRIFLCFFRVCVCHTKRYLLKFRFSLWLNLFIHRIFSHCFRVTPVFASPVSQIVVTTAFLLSSFFVEMFASCTHTHVCFGPNPCVC